MAPRLLLIGGSGHIGAATLRAVEAAFPDFSYDALVRTDEDADDIHQLYPESVNTVKGTLWDVDVVEAAASRAQIVINCAPDVPHKEGIAAIIRGLSSSSFPHKFYIQTSGAARLWDAPDGNKPGRVWDDVSDLDAFPTDTTHAAPDIQALGANTDSVHVAVVSPCFVVGRTPSRRHKPPITFPDLFHVARAAGGLFTVDAGANVTSFVDTESLAGLYVALVRNAAQVLDGRAALETEIWGPRGYFFAANLEMPMREFMEKRLAPALKRQGGEALLGGDGKAKSLTVDRVTELIMGRLGEGSTAALWSRHIAEGFGTGMRVRGTRAARYLGYEWVPDLPGLDDAVAAILKEI